MNRSIKPVVVLLEDVDALQLAVADVRLEEEDRRRAVAPLSCVAEVLEDRRDEAQDPATCSLPWYGLYTAGLRKTTSSAIVASAGVVVVREDRECERVVHVESSASLTSRSASSLCARFTCRYSTPASPRASDVASSEEPAQRLVLDAILAAHLLHEQLRVRDDLDLRHMQLDRLLEAGDEPAVLGDVVRRDADRLALRGEDGAVLRLEHEPVGRRPGIPACAAVGEEACLHGRTALLDRSERRLVEVDPGRACVLAHLFGAGRTDDRAREVRLAQHPGERELPHRDPETVGDRAQALHAARGRRRRGTAT